LPRIEGSTRPPLATWKLLFISFNIPLSCVAAIPLVCYACIWGPSSKFLAWVSSVIFGIRDPVFLAFGWLLLGAISETPTYTWCAGLLIAIFVSALALVLIPKMPKVVILLLAPVQAILSLLSIWVLYMLHSQPHRHM
jgi:hypothetical protein